MKSFQLIVVLLAVVLVNYSAGEGMLDKINVDVYLKNNKLIEYHIICLAYDGPCDKIGSEIKRLFPMVGKQCRGCTDMQKQKLGKIIAHLQRYYPVAWQDMARKMQNY